MNQIAINITSYFYQKKKEIYDHPTKISKINQEETLTRLLNSINQRVGDCFLIRIYLIPGKTKELCLKERQIEEAMIKMLKKKYKKKKNVQIYLLGERALRELKKIDKNKIIDNKHYGNIRNLQLISQVVFNEPFQLNLDDDEIIIDDNFFERVEYIKKRINQQKNIAGVGGFYVDRTSSPHISKKDKERMTGNLFKNKEFIMQASIDRYQGRKWTKFAPAVYGGLNITKQELAKKICYDPSIQRGEDIDYVINAMFEGFFFSFFRDFKICHLPPGVKAGSHFGPNLEKIRKDVLRFIYEKLKVDFFIKKNKLNKNNFYKKLDPYPGYFLRKEIEELKRGATNFFDLKEVEDYISKQAPLMIERYLLLSRGWKNFIKKVIEKRQELQNYYIKIF